eukprot:17538-Alexandrium_andersonii.AAC.1
MGVRHLVGDPHPGAHARVGERRDVCAHIEEHHNTQPVHVVGDKLDGGVLSWARGHQDALRNEKASSTQCAQVPV